MKDRIKKIRTSFRGNKESQESFADFIGISKSNLASYEVGRRKPSDAVIKLICQKCSINEKWLREGVGEMYVPEEDEVAAYVSDLLEEDNPFYDIIKGIMKTYTSLGEKEKSVVKGFAKELQKNLKGNG